ncbi:precorrin-6A synthase (deacetylating) [Paraconexibacter sp.]|uniref:precorrin-6A synthase (deacetylating) n=1 Tax=Paraconexibacter sp. TaxID=2949640 RepID=UPI003561B4D6
MSRRLLLVGIGVGDPNHVTVQAVTALNAFDVLFVVEKGEQVDDLVAARREVLRRHRTPQAGPYRTVALPDPPRPWRTAPDYASAVRRWRAERRELWTRALGEHLAEGETGAFLVWGDPSLYESTLAVVQEVLADDAPDVSLDVLPGISSVHALTARHRIPLNRVGRTVQVTPARQLAEHGVPAGVDDVVVMLDAHATFASLPDPEAFDIYWGAYLGAPDELLVAGPLDAVADEIVRLRARVRQEKGWMFDTYLLRRR